MSGIREALETAFETVSGDSDNGDAEVVSNVDAEPASPPEPTTEATEPQPTQAPAEASATETPAEKAARARDDKGRFAAKTKASKLTGPSGQQTPAPVNEASPLPVDGATLPAQAKPAEPEVKAPQSWTPAEREHFAKAPLEVRQAIARRERDVQVAMQEHATAKKFHQEFQQTVSPFAGMIQAEGGEPLGAVRNLLQTAAALRTAPPHHKAKLVADIVRQFGVPIDALDAHLAGEAPAANAQQQQFDPNTIAQRVEQQILQRMQQTRAQSHAVEARQSVEAFKANAEFLDDVKDDVADLIEVAARRGRALTLEQAYNQACKMHPEISKVLEQRQQSEQAKAQLASTQRAKTASVSVKSQPAGVAAPGPKSIRSVMDEAAAKLATGRR